MTNPLIIAAQIIRTGDDRDKVVALRIAGYSNEAAALHDAIAKAAWWRQEMDKYGSEVFDALRGTTTAQDNPVPDGHMEASHKASERLYDALAAADEIADQIEAQCDGFEIAVYQESQVVS